MDYKKTYDKIIQNRINNPLTTEEYSEKHHIIPRCLGGSNKKENIVKLTSREHFICHALLAEMYDKETPEWYKMNHAFKMMKPQSKLNSNNRYFNSRLYELKRTDFSKSMSNTQTGNKNSQYGKVWIHNLELKKSSRVLKSELSYYLSIGWVIGRIVNFELNEFKSNLKISKLKNSDSRRKDKIEIAKNLFYNFIDSKCESIREYCIQYNIDKSQGQLSSMWKRFIPELYNPVPRTKFKNRI